MAGGLLFWFTNDEDGQEDAEEDADEDGDDSEDQENYDDHHSAPDTLSLFGSTVGYPEDDAEVEVEEVD